jgi:hypothetical protein
MTLMKMLLEFIATNHTGLKNEDTGQAVICFAHTIPPEQVNLYQTTRWYIPKNNIIHSNL